MGFILITVLFVIAIDLLKIVKKQIMKPLFDNYAISGRNGRITIEKLKISPCPICGGKMRYYNRPCEWHILITIGK